MDTIQTLIERKIMLDETIKRLDHILVATEHLDTEETRKLNEAYDVMVKNRIIIKDILNSRYEKYS